MFSIITHFNAGFEFTSSFTLIYKIASQILKKIPDWLPKAEFLATPQDHLEISRPPLTKKSLRTTVTVLRYYENNFAQIKI